mgnify:CR=1 FL=1
MAMSWSHVVLYVKDTDKMLDFYTRVLGFQVTDRGEIPGRGSEIIFLSQDPDEHHQVGMVPMREDAGPSNSVAHIAFRVENMDELRSKIEALQGEGVEMRPTSHGNTWSIYMQDPEQNGIEIFCDTPWHVTQPQGKTWDITADDQTLMAWTKSEFEGEKGFEPKAEYHKRMAKEMA